MDKFLLTAKVTISVYTTLNSERYTKGFIFSFFEGRFYFVNNFLRFLLCISYTRCIFAPNKLNKQ